MTPLARLGSGLSSLGDGDCAGCNALDVPLGFVGDNGYEVCRRCVQEAPKGAQTGSARDVLDYIEWMEHVGWVWSVCDTAETAMAAFNAFSRTASAERGRVNA